MIRVCIYGDCIYRELVPVRAWYAKQIVQIGKKLVHCVDIYRWIDYQLKSYAVTSIYENI
jgi:hypothetical protein